MIRRTLGAAALLLLASCQQSVDQTNPPLANITVFAAASLQPAFDRIVKHVLPPELHATFSYAGTQTLTTQLTEGAKADVFASADTTHMKTVQDAGLLADAPQLFAHNRLEIAVAKGNPKGIHQLADLSRSGLVVVLADSSVPVGKYARQSLTKAGVSVKPASLELEVTAVLNKVVLGEADAGIVYHSDIVTSGKVDGVPIPDEVNVIADYSIAALKTASSPHGANGFIEYVMSSKGQDLLKASGFEGA